MVPNVPNWKQKLFKNILKLDRGSSPRPIVDFMTEDDDGVNWIKIGDTKKGELYINSTKEKITPEGAKKSRKVSRGEIIVSNSMSYGQPYILNIDGYIHDGWFVIRNYEKDFDKEFLLQLLGSELIQRQYKRLAAGGVVSNISSELVYAVRVALPPLPEQQKIAKILSTWDKAIATTEKLIATSQQQKKALMQQLLTGKKRLVNPETGKVFEGNWEEVKLGDLFKLSSGDKKPDDVESIQSQNNKYPVYGGNNIMGYSSEYNSDCSVILIGRVGEYCGVTRLVTNKCWLTDNALYTKSISNDVCNEFLTYQLKQYDLSRLRNKGGQPLISQKPIYGVNIGLPVLNEQQKIASVLTAADKEIELLQAKLAHIQDEKKALMQQLLTGKRRVKVEAMEMA
ncbi:restriction endonuclease subunit S [Vibrio parahaemolyticus]|nr:restriction endonuclease subunit S [Vibrio parahaemolyticus]MDF4302050.1 restriction endonuclease subunit S [Vibrio parahaemolyticus]MDF5288418.1 restriction endonuclease subunit S [Vibrio parahaemolyticus]MDF5292860.1 restriction endonuclease subunit S [Vibrio parahaemolyticus]MDF5302431.1 restriction endonuclease subunit S [Vibrio parahaemolyticus]